jgi:hypothetical protein
MQRNRLALGGLAPNYPAKRLALGARDIGAGDDCTLSGVEPHGGHGLGLFE